MDLIAYIYRCHNLVKDAILSFVFGNTFGTAELEEKEMNKEIHEKPLLRIKDLIGSKASFVWACISLLLFSFALGIDFSDNRQAALIDAFSYHDGEAVWENIPKRTNLWGGSIVWPIRFKTPYLDRSTSFHPSASSEPLSNGQLDLIYQSQNALPTDVSFSDRSPRVSLLGESIRFPKDGFEHFYGPYNAVIDSRVKEHRMLPILFGRLPSNENEMAISDCSASLMKGLGYVNEEEQIVKPASSDDLLGVTISSKVIVGIFETSFSSSLFSSLSLTEETLNQAGRWEELDSYLKDHRRVESCVVYSENHDTSTFFFRTSGNLIADSFFLLRLGIAPPFQKVLGYAYVLSTPAFLWIAYAISFSLFLVASILEKRFFLKRKRGLEELLSEQDPQIKKGSLFLLIYRKILPWHLLVGGAAILVSEAALLIADFFSHAFYFSHFMVSCLLLALIIACYDAFLAYRKAKLLLGEKKPE